MLCEFIVDLIRNMKRLSLQSGFLFFIFLPVPYTERSVFCYMSFIYLLRIF